MSFCLIKRENEEEEKGKREGKKKENGQVNDLLTVNMVSTTAIMAGENSFKLHNSVFVGLLKTTEESRV
jgi:hypothetical protein